METRTVTDFGIDPGRWYSFRVVCECLSVGRNRRQGIANTLEPGDECIPNGKDWIVTGRHALEAIRRYHLE